MPDFEKFSLKSPRLLLRRNHQPMVATSEGIQKRSLLRDATHDYNFLKTQAHPFF
jgi:hypothetical protein